jgi:hypothetical protein
MALVRGAAAKWRFPRLWHGDRPLRRPTAKVGARKRRADFGLMAGCVGACMIFGASAEANDANSGVHWLRKCTNPEPALQIECTIYVRALIEYDEMRANTLGQTRLICPEKGFTMGQAREVVVSYLRDKPEELHRPFALLAHLALQAALPCNR